MISSDKPVAKLDDNGEKITILGISDRAQINSGVCGNANVMIDDDQTTITIVGIDRTIR